ncbi:hypothetical protein Hanom_Chr04g00298251 [Helianthus anomalus]
MFNSVEPIPCFVSSPISACSPVVTKSTKSKSTAAAQQPVAPAHYVQNAGFITKQNEEKLTLAASMIS